MPHKFWIRRIGDVLHPVSKDDKEKCQELTEGETIKVEAKLSRSGDHHRFFFAAIAEACANWPESHEFQTKNPERLRAWLLCKAGSPYREHLKYEAETLQQAAMMADFFDHMLEHLGVKAITCVSEKLVYILYPKSISFSSMGQDEFNVISERVNQILLEQIGLGLNELKREAGRAA